MLKKMSTCVPIALALALILPGSVQAAKNEWKQIKVKDRVKIKLPDGSNRELKPSCSGGPIKLDEQTIVQADTQYSFFISKGDSKKILLALDGGGGCWDAATCLGSPLDPGSFGNRPTYTPVVDDSIESLEASGGVLDTDSPDNPYRDYTKIFVPYCTGDIHWGSKDTTYFLPNLGEWTIHHRGADNLLAVLDWLKQEGINLKNASDISVVGASAGGYGADIAFAYAAERAGDETNLTLISDSAIGVIDNPLEPPLSFYRTAIYDGSGGESWGVAQNLPKSIYESLHFSTPEDFLESRESNPISLVPSIFAALSLYRPDAKLAMVTTNVDLVQISFYILMNKLNFLPITTPTDQQLAAEWYCSMAAITAGTLNNTLNNYTYFVEGGDFHTFLFGDVFGALTYDPFYTAGPSLVKLSDWTAQLIDPDGSLPTPVFEPFFPIELCSFSG